MLNLQKEVRATVQREAAEVNDITYRVSKGGDGYFLLSDSLMKSLDIAEKNSADIFRNPEDNSFYLAVMQENKGTILKSREGVTKSNRFIFESSLDNMALGGLVATERPAGYIAALKLGEEIPAENVEDSVKIFKLEVDALKGRAATAAAKAAKGEETSDEDLEEKEDETEAVEGTSVTAWAE